MRFVEARGGDHSEGSLCCLGGRGDGRVLLGRSCGVLLVLGAVVCLLALVFSLGDESEIDLSEFLGF